MRVSPSTRGMLIRCPSLHLLCSQSRTCIPFPKWHRLRKWPVCTRYRLCNIHCCMLHNDLLPISNRPQCKWHMPPRNQRCMCIFHCTMSPLISVHNHCCMLHIGHLLFVQQSHGKWRNCHQIPWCMRMQRMQGRCFHPDLRRHYIRRCMYMSFR